MPRSPGYAPFRFDRAEALVLGVVPREELDKLSMGECYTYVLLTTLFGTIVLLCQRYRHTA